MSDMRSASVPLWDWAGFVEEREMSTVLQEPEGFSRDNLSDGPHARVSPSDLPVCINPVTVFFLLLLVLLYHLFMGCFDFFASPQDKAPRSAHS